jgi:uncharacterized protein DUF5908
MPLEISEIGIYVRVAGEEAAPDAAEPAAAAEPAPDREQVVQECVRRVLQALRLAQER